MSIRSLRPDEEIPASSPKRYRNGAGDIRLRWNVGPQEWVEEYEHRIVMGRPAGEVHHRNGIKDDNRPENLVALSREEHARLHGAACVRQFEPYRSRDAMEKAQRAEARRAAYLERALAMRAEYESGQSIIGIAREYGISNASVHVSLRSAGTQMRPRGTAFYLPGIDYSAIQSMHAEGIRAGEMCLRLGIGRRRLYQAFDQLGLPRFGPGNPTPANNGSTASATERGAA